MFITGCTKLASPPEASHTHCTDSTTPIASVQGYGGESPLKGRQVQVQGIVTLIQDGQGIYIEEPGSDTDPHTSNALFVQTDHLPAEIESGALISIRGTVLETGEGRDTLTALTGIGDPVLCASGLTLPLIDVSLPLDDTGRESLEGMRIRIDDELVVTGVYQFEQGKFTVSSNGLQYIPTEIVKPGPEAAEQLARNRAAALPVLLPDSIESPDLVVSGTTVDQVTGVLAHERRGKRLTLQSISGISSPDFAVPVTGSPDALRVVGMNLHNYFNGDGKGQGFPTPRGAETIADFQQQRDRIGAAIEVLDPHVVAVMELENDGFGPDGAAQDFIRLANRATQETWAVNRPVDDDTGTDQITVGLFYRTDRLKAVGPSQTLSGPEFKRSRQPQAQLFQQLPGGETLLVVVNHLKSKGSCPDSGEDADLKDGQGCWNPMRRVSAEKMSAWSMQLATSMGTDNILILGDMNAYRYEDPVNAIRDAGFTELMETKKLPTYSFVYGGQHGTLDYAFVSDALLGQVQQAYIWHVNAAFPSHMELPQPWSGFSDHDPVIIELRLRHSRTSD